MHDELEMLGGLKQDENQRFYTLARNKRGELYRFDCDMHGRVMVNEPIKVKMVEKTIRGRNKKGQWATATVKVEA